jgi:mono/diheme cytochrome c family protein
VRVWGRWSLGLAVAVAAAAGPGCKSSAPAATCPPAPVDPPCPDAVPSFEHDIYPSIFAPACVPCHSSTGVEPNSPLTSYQQIYGTDGTMAREIYFQVFQACLMPPPDGPELLLDEQRQKLLDWFGCGAPDSP